MRGIGWVMLAGVMLLAAEPAPAQVEEAMEDAVTAVDGPKAFVSVEDDRNAGVGFAVRYDGEGIPSAQHVTATLSSDGRRIYLSAPGIHILSRSPLCTGGRGSAHCQGVAFEELEAQLGPGDDRWTTHVPDGGRLDDLVHGGDGNDLLRGSAHGGYLLGEGGDDELIVRARHRYGGGYGGPGHDRLTAVHANALAGDDGNDVLVGGASPGSLEQTRLSGGPGDDRITGGPDHDSILGGAGADVIAAGGGDDAISPGTGTDEVDGGDGSDVASYRDHPEPVAVSLWDGIANEGAAGEGDRLVSIEHAGGSLPTDGVPGPGSDHLAGDDGANTLFSARGQEGLLEGRGGDDFLYIARVMSGGDGDDELLVRDGDDAELDGGNGNDTFRFDRFVGSCDGFGSCWPTEYGTVSVQGGPGNDVIEGAFPEGDPAMGEVDHEPDDIRCGDGWDVVTADLEDAVALDCEVVTRR